MRSDLHHLPERQQRELERVRDTLLAGFEAAKNGGGGGTQEDADKLTSPSRNIPLPSPISGCLRRDRPRGLGLTTQDAEAGSGNQMRLEVEGVVDRTVAGKKTLS